MLKFKTFEDKVSFLSEIGRLDHLATKEADLPIDLCEIFFKKNKKRVKMLVDFKKSQASSKQWRTNKWAMMKGIHKFHRSIEGKRFHRSLGRFLATRIFEPVRLQQLPSLRAEAAKAVSSVRTHLYIESQYYRSVSDDVDFELFMDYARPLLQEVENCVYEGDERSIDDDGLELLLRLVESSELSKALVSLSNGAFKTGDPIFEGVDLAKDYAMLDLLKSALPNTTVSK